MVRTPRASHTVCHIPRMYLLSTLSRKPLARACVAAVCTLAATATSASAAQLPGANISATTFVPAVTYPGIQHLHYEYGPVQIVPGQNTIDFGPEQAEARRARATSRASSPNLIYASNHKVPRVDVIHLHHGVWVMNGYPTFAAGEEKTIFNAPQGYGYHYKPSDSWIMNYMIHNLTPTPTKVFITYDIDFVPDSTPAAAVDHAGPPDVDGRGGHQGLPGLRRDQGHRQEGQVHVPERRARRREEATIGPAHSGRWTKRRDARGHGGAPPSGRALHGPHGTRNGATKQLFRSQAKYFEPAGAVSWDVSMTATKPDWQVALKAGDMVDVSSTYDMSKASWYESMGIMVTWYADGVAAGRE